MLESLNPYSKVFMLLIKLMVCMTSAGNNNGDLLPSSYSIVSYNLYAPVTSV